MSRRRYISTNISLDARVNRLATEYGDFAALLYTWMIPHALDDGTLTANPEEILFLVVPGRRDKSVEDIVAAIAGMVALDLIMECGDNLQFPSESFYRYQTYVQGSRRPAALTAEPPSIKEEPAQNAADQRESAQNAASSSSSFSFPVSFPVSRSAEEDTAASPPEPAPAEQPSTKEIFDYYRRRIQPEARICPDERIKARLRHFTTADLLKAIDNFAADEWQMDHNRTRGAPWFFKSDERIEQYVNLIPTKERTNGANRERSNGSHGSAGSQSAKQSGRAAISDAERAEIATYGFRPRTIPAAGGGGRGGGAGSSDAAPPVDARPSANRAVAGSV